MSEMTTTTWDDVLDKLAHMRAEPGEYEDDDFTSPTRPACDKAAGLCGMMMSLGVAPPLRALPDGDGAIVLDWRDDGGVCCTLEADRCGQVELDVFVDCKHALRLAEKQHTGTLLADVLAYLDDAARDLDGQDRDGNGLLLACGHNGPNYSPDSHERVRELRRRVAEVMGRCG
ncbi:MAG TPA: hypothetical protein VM487_06505 [Phycisphaerae bacterium]|nr:hypothetical protein [Phycisphaerae bacterium]